MRQILQIPLSPGFGINCLYIVAGLFTSMSVWPQLPTIRQVAGKMKTGWNMGNTLEAIYGKNEWEGTATTRVFINSVKAAGFEAVLLPAACMLFRYK